MHSFYVWEAQCIWPFPFFIAAYLVCKLKKVRTSIKVKNIHKNQLNELLCVFGILMSPLRISSSIIALGLKLLKLFLIGICALTF